MKTLLILSMLCFGSCYILKSKKENTWAVLSAGPKGWGTYAGQSSVCHAYQVLVKHGVPSDKIITIMYDDNANDPLNPYPGKLFNEPNGPDVYEGCQVDYRGDDVNPETIMNVLKGNVTGNEGRGTGRVLQSGPKDHVFVYHIGHGGDGCIYMPDSSILTKKDLNGTLQHMHDNNMYKQLLFYLETCFSGSIFDGTSSDLNIYAVTAAAPDETAAMAYCNTPFLNSTCIGSQFANAWMHNAETNNLLIETLGQQVDDVKAMVNRSTVCQYGDKKERKEAVSDYEGSKKLAQTEKSVDDTDEGSVIRFSDVHLIVAKEKMRQSGYSEEEVEKEMARNDEKRKELTNFVQKIAAAIVPNHALLKDVMTKTPTITQLDCHDKVVKAFSKLCAPFDNNPFARKLVKVFANLCEVTRDDKPIMEHFEKECLNGYRFTNVL